MSACPPARRAGVAAAIVAATLALGGCDGGLAYVRSLSNEHPVVPADAALRIVGADAARGRTLLAEHACTTCHAVPGERRFNTHVGPPLGQFARRSNIAGELPNQPEALVRFIMNAPREVPGTAMPNLGVDEAEARDIAAYLYTLR